MPLGYKNHVKVLFSRLDDIDLTHHICIAALWSPKFDALTNEN